MDKTTAQRIVKETFRDAFDRYRFRNFVNELTNGFDEAKKQTMQIPDAFKPHVASCQRIGTYESPESELADILIVHLTESYKLERTRTALRDFVAHKLKRGDGEDNAYKEAALVAFVAPDTQSWRFSFVRMEYETKRDPKTGRIKPEERLTPARRYSYLVGAEEQCHTAQARFLDLLRDTTSSPTLAKIEEAFSVETVTKEFFDQYAALFQRTHAALEAIIAKDRVVKADFQAKGVCTVDFAKKLLGQIVFLYFIQKKGWLGVPKGGKWGDGPKNFMRKLADRSIADGKCLFNEVLEPLFYDTLATDRGHEAWCKPFACRIPFLNGGLFEPISGYDWQSTNLAFSNDLFTNRELTKEGDTGTGILDVFDRYNFTVNEAEPLEKEVAIDPEMLGKVFENLIEENRRKGLGAYYTPREIVHYMCQESLINYLDATVNKVSTEVPRADIEIFIREGDQAAHYETARKGGTVSYTPKLSRSIETHSRALDDALKSITVCDPAIGSGAFPVGMMTEIVKARTALTPYFNDVAERTPYHFKRHAIQNSIYGVDIDAGAVEIAKLRLWLSLVVDEEDVAQIKPLPNLDYKIMQGNSLIQDFEGVKLFDESFISKESDDSQEKEKSRLENQRLVIQREYLPGIHNGQLSESRRNELDEELTKIKLALDKIEKAQRKAAKTELKKGDPLFELISEARKKAKQLDAQQREFFDASSAERKLQLREQITRLEWELIEATLKEQGKSHSISKLEPFKKTGEKPYFLWKLNFSEVFRQKNGFDIVIANPPYVDSEEMTRSSPELRGLLTQIFRSAKGNWDLFVVFIEQGLNHANASGIASYIIPNKLLGAPYAKYIRGILNENHVNYIRDYSSVSVFESVAVYPVVFQAGKKASSGSVVMQRMDTLLTAEITHQIESDIFRKADSWDHFLQDQGHSSLLERINAWQPLHEHCHSVISSATVSEAYTLAEQMNENPNPDLSKFKKFINTGTIDPFKSLWGKQNTRYIKRGYLHPVVRDTSIREMNDRRLQQACAEKLIIGGMTLRLECYYDKGEYLAGKSTVIVLPKSGVPILYLGAVINSKCASYWYRTFFKSMSLAGGYLRIGHAQLKMLPVPPYEKETGGPIIEIAKCLLNDPDSENLWKQLNCRVCKLYGLNPKEIDIIENSAK